MSYFNAVTCRIAPHHFARVDRFVGECARVLALSGRVAIVDNVAPEEGGEYLDMFERLRDPSHVHCLTVAAWKRQLYDAGFDMMHHENLHKRMDFAAWVAQQRTPPEIAEQLADMLRNAPAAAAWWLRPEIDSAGTVQAFTLTEGLFVARRRD
jgi:ubiquinone/menaquinone biosynthesis C-methylase UbiE